MENLQNKYRYERKYKLKIEEYDFFYQKLIAQGFKKHYPARKVNNIYLDTFSNDSFIENVEGESKRDKFRLRWYGERFNELDPTFEIKQKIDSVNKKQSVKIPKIKFFKLNQINSVIDHLQVFLKESSIKFYLKTLNKTPTLLNGYSREYFITTDNQVRLTIDRQLYYYNVINGQSYLDESKLIIEVKYASKTIPKINFENLGLVLSKNSKYVSGLEYTSV